MERTLSQNEAKVVLNLEWRKQKTVTLAGPTDSHEFPFVPEDTGRFIFEVDVDQFDVFLSKYPQRGGYPLVAQRATLSSEDAC